jgi:hypothetical protein
VAILISAAIGSPAAAGTLCVAFALSTLSLKRLLRPSQWPRLIAWPCWTWGTIFYMVLALFHAWFYAPAPDILTCEPLGDLNFCWEWLWQKSRIPAGVYLVLVAYDYLQYCDFCDPETEVRIARIARSDRRWASLVVLSNVELSSTQLFFLQVTFCLRSVECLFEQLCFEGVGFHLAFLSARFTAERDGSRTRRVSRWTSPSCGEALRFSYYRPFMERMDSHLSDCPFAIGFALFALHKAILEFGYYDVTKLGWIVGIAWIVWLKLAPTVDACLDVCVDLCRGIDASVAPCCELAWRVVSNMIVWEMVLFVYGTIVLDDPEVDLAASVRTFTVMMTSCVALHLFSEIPFVGYPLKCAGRAAAPRIAIAIKATIRAALVVLRMLVVTASFSAAGAATVLVRVPALALVHFVCAVKKAIAWCCVCVNSPRRHMAVLPPREARLKYRRPRVVSLADTWREVEPARGRGEGGRNAPSRAAGGSPSKRRALAERAGRCKSMAVARKLRNRGVILGAMASSVAPVRRSVRVARRAAGSFSRGSVS